MTTGSSESLKITKNIISNKLVMHFQISPSTIPVHNLIKSNAKEEKLNFHLKNKF